MHDPIRPIILLVVLLVVPLSGAVDSTAAAAAAAAAPPFADGEVVALVGDSITHSGRWHLYIADFYATRFPGRQVRFLNCGISGDTAGGVLARLDVDILVHHPTVAVVMLGMNDVGQNSYKAGRDGDAKVVTAREQAITSYQNNLTKVVERLQAGGVKRLVLVTPSPFDQTAQMQQENLPGVNDALGRCGTFVTGLAGRLGAGLVDFNGPMTALNLERQRQDPAFTLIGPDRGHPGAPGHLVMAWLFLKAQGVPALVSRIELDAHARQQRSLQSAQLAGLTWKDDGVEFESTEDALPWHFETEAQKALPWASIVEDLNRQDLVVDGLPAGTYALAIDGAQVGSWPASALATGVNLALVPTPQANQAQKVQKLCEERHALQSRLRSIAHVELKWFKPGTVDFTDVAATATAMDAFVAKGGGAAAYFRNVANTYRKTKPEAAQLGKQVDDLVGRIGEAARPTAHRYVLHRTGG